MHIWQLFSENAPPVSEGIPILSQPEWLLVVLAVTAVLVWALRDNLEEATVTIGHGEVHHEEPPKPDDLKLIEGIGPKISAIMAAAGISTFAQMAETSVEKLQAILDEAGIRLGDPATWPQQAGLAAQGEWGALEKLQEELQGGRRE
jgi:hypothetical protein